MLAMHIQSYITGIFYSTVMYCMMSHAAYIRMSILAHECSQYSRIPHISVLKTGCLYRLYQNMALCIVTVIYIRMHNYSYFNISECMCYIHLNFIVHLLMCLSAILFYDLPLIHYWRIAVCAFRLNCP